MGLTLKSGLRILIGAREGPNPLSYFYDNFTLLNKNNPAALQHEIIKEMAHPNFHFSLKLFSRTPGIIFIKLEAGSIHPLNQCTNNNMTIKRHEKKHIQPATNSELYIPKIVE